VSDDTTTIGIGNTVRENWSGITGLVIQIDGSMALVQWPAKAKWVRIDFLVVSEK
jgi:hypothetical protein